MNQADFNKDLLLSLSAGLVDVEFDLIDQDGDDLLDFAFRRARDTYIQKGADDWKKQDLALSIVAGQKTYDLPADPKVSTVVKIIKPTAGFNISDPHGLAAFNNIFGDNFNGGTSSGYVDLAMYQISMMRLEEINKYTAYMEDFHHDSRANKLHLTRAPQVNETWFAEVYTQMTDDEYRDVLWVKEYTEAMTKILLGQAYRKLDGAVAGPNGPLNLSGGDYIREGNEKIALLIEDIANYTDGDIQFSGVWMG